METFDSILHYIYYDGYIAKYIYASAFHISTLTTGIIFMMDKKDQQIRKNRYYFLIFIFVYIFALPYSLNASDEINFDFNYEENQPNVLDGYEIFEKDRQFEQILKNGFNCDFGQDFYTVQSFLSYLKCLKQQPPTRQEIIAKIAHHNKFYGIAIYKCREILISYNAWCSTYEDLFQNVRNAGIIIISGGGSAMSVLIAFLEFVSEATIRYTKVYSEYCHYKEEAIYHAKMLDFYCDLLKELYGK